MAELLYRLGRAAAHRARTVIAIWVALLAVAGAGYAFGSGTLSDSFSIPGTPTQEVTDQLAEEIPAAAGGAGTVVLTTEDGEAFTDDQQSALSEVFAEAGETAGVEMVVDPFATEQQRQQQAAELEQGEEQLAAAQQQAEQAAAAGQPLPEEAAAELEQQAAALETGRTLFDLAADLRTVSEDGSTAVANVVFTEDQFSITQETRDGVLEVLEDGIADIDGVQADYGSDISMEPPAIVGPGEIVGLVVAGIVLVVMLGTLIGAGLPILTALVGVGIAAMGSLAFSGVVQMSSVTPVLGLMLGLAVGIDYALFIVNRHRRQLKEGYEVHDSIALANGTSGNAVVFAGATVVIALLALNVTGIPFLGLMGTVGAAAVAIAVLVAITLTPALLSLIGQRALSRKERAVLAEQHGEPVDGHVHLGEPGVHAAAGPVPDTSQVKPMSTAAAVIRAVLGVAVLAAIAIPALDLRTNLPDGSSEPPESTQYQAYTTIAEEFGAGVNGPLVVAAEIEGGADEQTLQALQASIAQRLAENPDVTAVAPASAAEDGSLIAFQVVPEGGPTSVSTADLVDDLRSSSPLSIETPDGTQDVEIGVAGAASGNIDISDKLNEALPVYLAVVIGLSLLILVLVFRSIMVPLIATLGFILSYFAALGGVVAIYQWGWLSSIFGVDNPAPVLNFLPTILVGILFGLAMDYMLFLGTGMREAYAHGAPSRIAVVQGFRAGRAVVTAAAIIMTSVFGGFIFAEDALIRPIGFALAFGVLVDAFVVRMTIIPALMHLLGDAAWWLPRWLDRLLPDVDVEGAALERRHPHGEQAGDTEPAGDTGPAGDHEPVATGRPAR